VRHAVTAQRELAVEEERNAMAAITREGCEVLELDPVEHASFVAAVQPLRTEARKLYPAELLSLLP
jgi:TRAP-type C4-dicarboxylate transport system substrate-binding protein